MATIPTAKKNHGQQVVDWLKEARPDVTWPFDASAIIDASVTTSVVTYWRTRGGMHYEAVHPNNWDDKPVGRTVTTTVVAEVFGAYPEFGDVRYGSETQERTTITESTERREFDEQVTAPTLRASEEYVEDEG